MGNRAVITFAPEGEAAVGVYVHWNGGRESVKAFIDTCKARGYRCPARDGSYAMAGLIGVIREFFGHSALNVGVDMLTRLDCDNWDNGVYQIGENWEIVGRWGKGSESLQVTREPLGTADRIKYQAIMDHLAESLKAAQPEDA